MMMILTCLQLMLMMTLDALILHSKMIGLKKLSPGATIAKINTVITTSTTLQEAAGSLCDETGAGSN